MATGIQVTVNSNRQFQRQLEESIARDYPEIKPTTIIRKAFDAIQTTTLVIAGTNLLINTVRLIIDLKKRHPSTEIEIELKSDDRSSTFRIGTNQSLDVEKVVQDFMSDAKKQVRR